VGGSGCCGRIQFCGEVETPRGVSTLGEKRAATAVATAAALAAVGW